MGTQVLRPQDCLVERIVTPHAAFSRRRSSANYGNYYYNCNYNYNHYNNHAGHPRSSRKPVNRSDQKKKVAVGSGQPVAAEAAVTLKRPSADDSRMARSSGFLMEKATTLRRGRSLDSAVKSDVYAGSAFAVSPSPSALPLPSFQTKKQGSAAFDDSATRDLRRLLRLE